MRSLRLLPLLGAALCPLGAGAQAAPADTPFKLRAIQPLPTEAVKAIATFGEPTVLARSNYPDAKHFTAKHVIEVLCGSYRESYWQATVKLNALGDASPQHVLGERVYTDPVARVRIRDPAEQQTASRRLQPHQRGQSLQGADRGERQ